MWSEKCQMKLTPFAKFSGRGRSASLLDDKIIMMGNDSLSDGNYIRKGGL